MPTGADDLTIKLASKRMIFINTKPDDQGKSKINIFESEMVLDCIQSFEKIFEANNILCKSDTIGVITPYRAQIAQIRKSMQDRGKDSDKYTIDTVERYQGGAREVVIISLCTNRFSQVQNMISLSDDGVDRKLNVALTRARKHLVIIGNEEILSSYPIYKELIEYCKSMV